MALRYLTNNDLAAQRFDQARAHASEVLELAVTLRGSWAYGDALHAGNTAIGRVALASGDLVEARRRLLASAEVDGSPVLNSFGPSMALAQSLLERGEVAVVLQYLERCRRFWGHGDILDVWEADIAANHIPDFGFNACL